MKLPTTTGTCINLFKSKINRSDKNGGDLLTINILTVLTINIQIN
jgi:hypothetical protein